MAGLAYNAPYPANILYEMFDAYQPEARTVVKTKDKRAYKEVLDTLCEANRKHIDGFLKSSVNQEAVKKMIEEQMQTLPQRDQFILQSRYVERRTLQWCGDTLDVSRERVRQLQNRAQEAFKTPEFMNCLIDLIWPIDHDQRIQAAMDAGYVPYLSKDWYKVLTTWVPMNAGFNAAQYVEVLYMHNLEPVFESLGLDQPKVASSIKMLSE